MMGIRTMMDKQKLKCVDEDYDEDCDYDGWKDRQTDTVVDSDSDDNCDYERLKEIVGWGGCGRWYLWWMDTVVAGWRMSRMDEDGCRRRRGRSSSG